MRLTPRADLALLSVPAESRALLFLFPFMPEPLTYVKRNLLDFHEPVTYYSRMAKRALPLEFRKYLAKLGRKGGLKGGPARAATMTREQRSESARKAVMARWERVPKSADNKRSGRTS
jgi:hypothetical protein